MVKSFLEAISHGACPLTPFLSYFHHSVNNPKAPSVYILSPSPDQLALKESASLICLVKDFNPKDIFVKWLHNEKPVDDSQYFTGEPVQESNSPERYYTHSMLNINEQDWNAGSTYTCLVGHERLPYQSVQKTVDKNTGKPSIVNISLVLSDTANSCY